MAKTTTPQITSTQQLTAQDIRALAKQLRGETPAAKPAKGSILVTAVLGYSALKGQFALARDAYVVAEHLRKQ